MDSISNRKREGMRISFCCSLVTPKSPEFINPQPITGQNAASVAPKSHISTNSFPNSPSPNPKSGLGFIDPRRILSPGRVSPIISEPAMELPDEVAAKSVPMQESTMKLEDLIADASADAEEEMGIDLRGNSMYVKLDFRGKNGGRLVLEVETKIVCKNSPYLAAMIEEYPCRESYLVEMADFEDMSVLKETIELMYEEDIARKLMKTGVSRSISILEVSYAIGFEQAIISCLSYLEAVPWSESEERKLKLLFTKYEFVGIKAKDILARIYPQESIASTPLAINLIHAVIDGTSPNTSRVLKSFVKGLLSPSSVYEKDSAGLTKEALYITCNACFSSLLRLFQEANNMIKAPAEPKAKGNTPAGQIAKQVDDINWLLEILIERQIGEEFVSLWGRQRELIELHKRSSPMVRYELSRISSQVLIGLGRRKLQCRRAERSIFFHAWFSPMLVDFGWLQRCSKGLDMRELEEAMGQALLTLPLKEQQSFFVEWVGCYAKRGTECPNLSGPFQVWWRRTFLRGTRTA